jgi:tRNA ligase
LYDYWVRKAIPDAPELFSSYQHNRGIVKARQQFLNWMDSPEGRKHLAREKGENPRETTSECPPTDSTERKTVIAPIAIPGCGKTSVAVALASIFGFGHTQSDDVVPKGKKTKTAAIFEGNVRRLLQSGESKVVIADKSVQPNHRVMSS